MKNNFFIIFICLFFSKVFALENLDIKSKKLDYVIELTKKLNGNVFIFGKLGQDYADVNYLNDNQILHHF